MAISHALLTGAYDSTDQTNGVYTTASISPTSGRLIILAVRSSAVTAPATPTASGNGLTWTQLRTELDNGSTRRQTIFYGLTSGASAGTVTIDHGVASAINGCAWSIVEFTGTVLTGTNGIDAIVQSNAATPSGSSTSVTVTLSAFGDATNNAAYCAVGHTANEATTNVLTTELHDVNGANPNYAFETEYQVGQSTSITPTWSTNAAGRIAQALELKAGSTAQTVSPSLIDQSAVLFAPTVNQQVTPSLIDQTAVLFSPKINQQVQPGLIDQTAVLFAPKINQQVNVGLVDQTATLFSPTVSIAGGAQAVSPGLIDQSGILFAPKVNQQVSVGLINQTAVLFAPKINLSVAVGLINQTAVLFSPQINQTITAELIDQSAILFSPAITGGAQPTGVGAKADVSMW